MHEVNLAKAYTRRGLCDVGRILGGLVIVAWVGKLVFLFGS